MFAAALLVGCVGVEGEVSPLAKGPPDAPDAHVPREPGPGAAPTGWVEPYWAGVHSDEDRPNGEALFAPGMLQELEIVLSDGAIADLRARPTEQVEATLVWERRPYTVALRLKGTTSFRDIDEKPSFKIDVHEYDPEQELDGLERLTLNNMIQDPSMLREHGYYWLMRERGVPAPRHAYARVTLNGEDYGLYGIVETLDEQFLKRAFPDDPDGNLYEADPADFTEEHDWFNLEEDGGVVPVWDDLEELVDAVDDTRSGGFNDMLEARFSPSVLDFLAVDMVTGNSDGYVYNFHNHLPYHGATNDLWHVVPWGADQAFRQEIPPLGSVTKPAEGYLFLACWDDPDCGPALRERAGEVLDLLDGPLHDHLVEMRALVEPACEDDDRRESSCRPEDTIEFVEARGEFLREYL